MKPLLRSGCAPSSLGGSRAASLLLIALALGCPKPTPTTPPDDTDESVTPSDPIEHAHQLLQAGKIDEALTVVEQALGSDPDNAELHFSKGVALRAKGQTDDAVAAWERALQLDPELVAARHGLAAIKLEAGQHAEAEAAYLEILQLEPDFKDAHYNLALALLAQGKTEAARGALENAHRLDPEDPDVAVELGRLLALEGKLAEAAELVGPAAAKATGDAGIQSTYGWLLDRLGRHEEAAAYFETAVTLRPDDDDARMGLARAWLKTDEVERAEQTLAQLAERKPDDPAIWLLWGSALGKQGKTEESITKLDRAIELAPKMHSAHVQKIGALVLVGRCKDAKAAKKKLDKLGPSDHAKRAVKAALAPCK